MNGKQHSICGLGASTAVGALVYKMSGDTFTSVTAGALVYPMAALPDIDHNKTKLGRVRKGVTTIVKMCTLAITGLSVIAYLTGKVDISTPLALGTICLVVYLLTQTKLWTKLFHHRGITHTLYFPLAFYLLGQYLGGAWYYIGLSIACGCIVHDLGDAVTVEGWNPLLFVPITIRLGHLKSEDKKLYGVAYLMATLYFILSIYIMNTF